VAVFVDADDVHFADEGSGADVDAEERVVGEPDTRPADRFRLLVAVGIPDVAVGNEEIWGLVTAVAFRFTGLKAVAGRPPDPTV
jgi:hypothetical protein